MNADIVLARVARRTLVISAVLTALGFLLGGLNGAAGVIGGAALAVMSLLLLKRGTARVGSGGSASVALVLVRYALVGLAAYVMVAVVQLNPLGLLAGASAIVLAIAFEAATLARR